MLRFYMLLGRSMPKQLVYWTLVYAAAKYIRDDEPMAKIPYAQVVGRVR